MYLFEYLGAVYKWMFFGVLNLILWKKPPLFKQILSPLEDSKDIVDVLAGGLSNKVVGFIITMIICSILVQVT